MVTERPACSIDGCDTPAAARGWCKRHYNQWRKTGTPTPKPRKVPDPCSADDCDKPSVARGMCKKHWHQWRRTQATEDQLQTTGRRWNSRTDPNALTGGEWRVDSKGIQRWHGSVPADEPDEGPPRYVTRQERPGQPVPLTSDDERHGTMTGYRAHYSQRIPYCDPCRQAEREYRVERGITKANYDRLDEAIIQRVLSGDMPERVSPRERTEICRRWFESGRSLTALAKITGWRPDRYFKVSEAA